ASRQAALGPRFVGRCREKPARVIPPRGPPGGKGAVSPSSATCEDGEENSAARADVRRRNRRRCACGQRARGYNPAGAGGGGAPASRRRGGGGWGCTEVGMARSRVRTAPLAGAPDHLEDCWDEPEATALRPDLELLQGAWDSVSSRRE